MHHLVQRADVGREVAEKMAKNGALDDEPFGLVHGRVLPRLAAVVRRGSLIRSVARIAYSASKSGVNALTLAMPASTLPWVSGAMPLRPACCPRNGLRRP